MATDVKISCPDGHFKYRVAGLLQRGDKYLGNIIQQNDYFCLPGGHVEIGESLDEAIIREASEELGFPVEVVKPLFIMENFYNKRGEKWHEVCCYYLLKSNYSPEKDWEMIENDKGILKRQQFKWLTKNELKAADFRPGIIKTEIDNLDKHFRVITKRY
ncbi:MAG: NUDIX hydrolase [Clostridia bacterium]